MGSKAITANRLTDGQVVYWTSQGGWTTSILEAATYADDGEAKTALADADAQQLSIVGAYLIDVEAPSAADVAPAGRKIVRETIRVKGPSAGSMHLHTREQRYGAAEA